LIPCVPLHTWAVGLAMPLVSEGTLRILTIAAKDCRQIAREGRSVLALVVLPILFTVFMGFAYGSRASKAAAPLRLGIVLEEQTVVAQRFERALGASRGISTTRVASVKDAQQWIAEGRIAAAVVVPQGFGAKLAVQRAPGLSLLANIATLSGQLARQAVSRSLLRLATSMGAARQALRAAEEIRGEKLLPQLRSEAENDAFDMWPTLAPLLQLEQTADDAGRASAQPSPLLSRASPGIIVMFAILGLIRSALVLVQERKQGTLARLLTTTTGRGAIIAGHLLGSALIVFMQSLALVLAGQLAFGLDYLHAPLALVGLLGALSLWVAALSVCIGALARSPEQVVLFGFIATIFLCALGGTWFPLDAVGGAFRALGELSPAAWAMQGLRTLLDADASANSVSRVAKASLALLAYAALFFAPALRTRAE
jgi:ABC-2 type transport system permease protein